MNNSPVHKKQKLLLPPPQTPHIGVINAMHNYCIKSSNVYTNSLLATTIKGYKSALNKTLREKNKKNDILIALANLNNITIIAGDMKLHINKSSQSTLCVKNTTTYAKKKLNWTMKDLVSKDSLLNQFLFGTNIWGEESPGLYSIDIFTIQFNNDAPYTVTRDNLNKNMVYITPPTKNEYEDSFIRTISSYSLKSQNGGTLVKILGRNRKIVIQDKIKGVVVKGIWISLNEAKNY